MHRNTELKQRGAEISDLFSQRFSGIVQASIFIIRFLAESRTKSSFGPEVISEYKEHMYRSKHYALEFEMYSNTVKLFLKDLKKIGYIVKTDDLLDSESRLSRLLQAVEDCLLAGYAYDDLIDNSPLRGSGVAYHLLKSKELVIDLYDEAKQKLISLLSELKMDIKSISNIQEVILEYESVADAEDSSHYYTIDLLDYHSIENMLSILDKKAGSLSQLVLMPFQELVGAVIPEDWKQAYKYAFSCAWLVNDLHKNDTETGIGNWIELKGGRLPLPVVIAIHTLTDLDRQKIIAVITQIWDLYKNLFTGEMTKNVIEQIAQIDETDQSKELFLEFKSLLMKSGVKQFISSELEKRVKFVRNISSEYKGLSSISFFLTALDGYMIEKKSKLAIRKIKSRF